MSESSDSEEDNPIVMKGISGIATTSTGIPVALDNSDIQQPGGGGTSGVGSSSRAIGTSSGASSTTKRARRKRRRHTHVHNASFSVHVGGGAAAAAAANNGNNIADDKVTVIGNGMGGMGMMGRPTSASNKGSTMNNMNGTMTSSHRPTSGRARASTVEELGLGLVNEDGSYDLERERQRKRDSVTGIGHIGFGLAPLSDAAQHTPPELSMLMTAATTNNTSSTLGSGHGHAHHGTRGSIVSGTSGMGSMMIGGDTITRQPSSSPTNRGVKSHRSHSKLTNNTPL
jgi:hypothetical protein